MKILVTGAAGFVGYHLAHRLLRQGHEVVGVDNFAPYYDVALKHARVAALHALGGRFTMRRQDLKDREPTAALFQPAKSGPAGFDRVVHLAAQAGVRHSLDHPHEYVDSNLVAFVNILEGCRHANVPHLLYASSSSVYGNHSETPYHTSAPATEPISLYAATKRAGELMAYSYAHLFGLRCTGLRFFTVYGPFGRPDMAYFKFSEAITQGRPIPVFNHGALSRDFTYVDDVIEGIVRLLDHPGQGAALFNIGAGRPTRLLDFIAALEDALQQKATLDMRPMQPGDVDTTWADTTALEAAVGYRPTTSIEEGMRRFVAWFREWKAR